MSEEKDLGTYRVSLMLVGSIDEDEATLDIEIQAEHELDARARLRAFLQVNVNRKRKSPMNTLSYEERIAIEEAIRKQLQALGYLWAWMAGRFPQETPYNPDWLVDATQKRDRQCILSLGVKALRDMCGES